MILRSARRLIAVSAACVLLGWAAIVRAWSHPDSVAATVLASACGWPWLLAAVDGALVWCSGRDGGSTRHPVRHFLAVYAAATAAAILIGGAFIALAGWRFAVLDFLPCGPLAPLCDTAIAMFLAAFFAGATAGLVFPALLPVALAAASAVLLRGRHPSPRRLAAAISATALGWLAAAAAGLALAHA